MTPKERARDIINQLQIDSVEVLAHLEEICWVRGAYVQYAPLESSEARVVMSGKKGVITVSPNPRYQSRSRFALAHELGHFELHRDKKTESKCDQSDLQNWSSREGAGQLEIEANEFAAELLMPESLFLKDIENCNPDIALIEDLSKKYGTSLTATAKRFVELTREPCMAVTFDPKKILFHWRSPSVVERKFWIKSGPLPKGTLAFKAALGEEASEKMSEIAASRWFGNAAAGSNEIIFEQTRFFKKLKRGLSLLWLRSPAWSD